MGHIASTTPALVCRAVQLIGAGALDDGTEAALGRRLGVSARHLRRLFHDHVGVTPSQLALSRRAHFARRLLDDSDLTIAQVAFASGFGSVRHFDRAMRDVFCSSPRELRERRRRHDRLVADGGLVLRLPFDPPYDWEATWRYLARRATAIPGVESVPGAWAPFEVGVQAIVSQRFDLASTRDAIAAIVRAYGTHVPGLRHGLTHAFPSADTIAGADLTTSPLLSRDVAGAITAFASAAAAHADQLDGTTGLDELIWFLTEIPGVELNAAHQIAFAPRPPRRLPTGDSATSSGRAGAGAVGRFARSPGRTMAPVARTGGDPSPRLLGHPRLDQPENGLSHRPSVRRRPA
ncbi:MAG TPA: helix-turn-helix domain-containing protein [Kribbella sp.]|nr:helix-turn-helix domain-containing protein [Kribbella sp.]